MLKLIIVHRLIAQMWNPCRLEVCDGTTVKMNVVNQMEALRKTFKSEKENAESQLKTIQIIQNSQVSTIEELSKEIAVLKSRLETKIENRDQNQSSADLDKIFKLQTELVEVGIQQENLKYEMQETLNSLLEHKVSYNLFLLNKLRNKHWIRTKNFLKLLKYLWKTKMNTWKN